jgi:2-hydroxychromene-2-carboxylate isomerase
MRGYISVSKDKQNDYLNCFFDAYWKDDQDLSNIESISKILIKLNIDNDEFFQSIKEQSIKDKLIKLTDDAFEKEVFGTPTFIVNNKVFWGQDRLEYALEEISNN